MENNAYDKHVITWEAPKYFSHSRGWIWFVIAGIIMLILTISALISQNWTLVVALLVFVGLYYWHHNNEVEIAQIKVSHTGIKVDNKEYAYQDIKYFWIIYEHGHIQTLHLRPNKQYATDIVIQLAKQDPAELRTFLCSQIRELEGKKEGTADALIRLLKI